MREILKPYQDRVLKALDVLLPQASDVPVVLHQAMRYMARNKSSKRIRAAMIYNIGDVLSGDERILDIAAASIEMFHIFSLIHDDLPIIDDSDLRHHEPSCHKAFNEHTALLAGDALLILGVNSLNKIAINLNQPAIASQLIDIMSQSLALLVKGEQLDIDNTSSIKDLSELEYIYNQKTTALFRAAVLTGAIASDVKDQQLLQYLENFANRIGLAFQIIDDIVDLESDTEILGKPQGHDMNAQKVTYPSLIGIKQSKEIAQNLYLEAIDNLNKTEYDFTELKQIAKFIINRQY